MPHRDKQRFASCIDKAECHWKAIDPCLEAHGMSPLYPEAPPSSR